jgi:hypothetical protein
MGEKPYASAAGYPNWGNPILVTKRTDQTHRRNGTGRRSFVPLRTDTPACRVPTGTKDHAPAAQ